MANKVRGYLVGYKGCEVVEFEDSLDNIYKIIDVDLIDVAVRKVGNFEYDIICDDEGLLKENPIPSVFDEKKKPTLFGNVLFVNSEDGEFTSLTDEQIKDLESHFGTVMIDMPENKTVISPCVIGAEYC